jgi:hypothetical protein
MQEGESMNLSMTKGDIYCYKLEKYVYIKDGKCNQDLCGYKKSFMCIENTK